jgi:hypothetical protein
MKKDWWARLMMKVMEKSPWYRRPFAFLLLKRDRGEKIDYERVDPQGAVTALLPEYTGLEFSMRTEDDRAD